MANPASSKQKPKASGQVPLGTFPKKDNTSESRYTAQLKPATKPSSYYTAPSSTIYKPSGKPSGTTTSQIQMGPLRIQVQNIVTDYLNRIRSRSSDVLENFMDGRTPVQGNQAIFGRGKSKTGTSQPQLMPESTATTTATPSPDIVKGPSASSTPVPGAKTRTKTKTETPQSADVIKTPEITQTPELTSTPEPPVFLAPDGTPITAPEPAPPAAPAPAPAGKISRFGSGAAAAARAVAAAAAAAAAGGAGALGGSKGVAKYAGQAALMGGLGYGIYDYLNSDKGTADPGAPPAAGTTTTTTTAAPPPASGTPTYNPQQWMLIVSQLTEELGDAIVAAVVNGEITLTEQQNAQLIKRLQEISAVATTEVVNPLAAEIAKLQEQLAGMVNAGPPPGGDTGIAQYDQLAQLMQIGKYAQPAPAPDRTRENEIYAMLQDSQKAKDALMQQYINALISQLDNKQQMPVPPVPAPASGSVPVNQYGYNLIPQVARQGSNLQFSNAGLGFLNSIDPSLLQALMQFLKAQQYTATGQMGTFGDLNYSRAGGTGSLVMNDASFENPLNYAGLTPQMREPAEAGLRSLFAGMGLTG